MLVFTIYTNVSHETYTNLSARATLQAESPSILPDKSGKIEGDSARRVR